MVSLRLTIGFAKSHLIINFRKKDMSEGGYKILFSHELQTHDNFPKDFKIITGREHSGERGNLV